MRPNNTEEHTYKAHRIWRLFAFSLLLIHLLTACTLPSTSAEENTPPATPIYRVLVLQSYHPTYLWTQDVMRGIQTSIEKADDLTIELYVEYMDTKRMPPEIVFPYLAALFRAKYHDMNFDAVIVSDQNALQFLLKYRQALFPDVPAVFCGINNFDDSLIAGEEMITGVIEEINIHDTLSLALQLHPNTRHVALINDRTPTGLANQGKFDEIIQEFTDQITVIELVDLTIEELQTTLQELPDDTIILQFSFHRDAAGSSLDLREYLTLIAQNTDKPIYGVWDYMLGHGILGGVVTSGYAQGENAADMVVRMLRGEPLDTIPILRESPNVPMFDYREMQRYEISHRDIPPDSIILYEPDTFFYRYRPYIGAVSGFMLIQTLIIAALIINIRRRQQVTIALQKSEANYRLLVENQNDIVVKFNPENKFLYVSPSYCTTFGKTEEELIGQQFFPLVHEDDRERVKASLQNLYKPPYTCAHEERALTVKGWQWFAWSNKALVNEAGEVIEIIAVGRNITQRKKAEQKFRTFFEENPDYCYIVSPTAIILDVNQAALNILGHTKQELIDHSLETIYAPESRAKMRALFKTWKQSGNISDEEITLITNKGERRTVLLNATTVKDKDGQVLHSLSIQRDITERKQASKERERLFHELQVQAQQMGQIMESVPEGVMLLDNAGIVLLANPAAKEHLSILSDKGVGDQLTNLGERPFEEFLPTPPKGHWHEVKVSNRIFEIITRPITTQTHQEGWVMVLRDATLFRQTQARTQQQEQLAAIGQLAAGIAHDFNNIMAVITLYADMILREPGLGHKVYERVQTMAEQAKHAARLTEQLLDFSRRGTLERQPLDVLPFLKEQVKLFQRTLPESIHIQLKAKPGSYLINADLARIQQALLNLVINARDAMPDGGELQLSLDQITITSPNTAPLPDMPTGKWIKLTIRDTGTGIPPNALPHIFEPFFTTKAPGKGSGLGLAQVHGIISTHRGYIQVETQISSGTTFTLYFPAGESERPISPGLRVPPTVKGKQQTILVVEDNAATRQAIVESLSLLNYNVLEATNGQEAINHIAEKGREIDLVLSDIVMPKMGGTTLLRTLRAQNYTMPFVLLTGQPDTQILESLKKTNNLSEWVTKPVELNHLAKIVAEALGKNQA